MSWKSVLQKITGTSEKPSSSTSYAPNISYLVNNPLQKQDYSFLLNPVKTETAKPSYTFLNEPLTQINNRASAYSNLMSTINAPSSVDTVRADITGQQYRNLLGDIDRATNQAMGSSVGGFYRRRLIDPNVGGISSDIASVGLGAVAAQGARDKTNAALSYQQNLLDLQKAREDAARSAMTTAYTTEASADNTMTQLANANRQLYANLIASGYSDEQARAESNRQLYANLLSNVQQLQNARDIAYATSQNTTSTGGTKGTTGLLDQFLGNASSEAGKMGGQYAMMSLLASDATVKEDIEPLTDALEIVENMKGIRFRYKADKKPMVGFIAQELEKELPELVVPMKDGTKAVMYAPVVAVLVEAVKTLANRVKELEAAHA